MRPPILRTYNEIIVDQFAGGGGVSTGIEAAIGRSPDVAINHDPEAIAMHQANHPDTRHFCESVWDVDPLEVAAGRPVGLMWLSPDCKHFSKAKGGKPVEKGIRGLAWIAVRWAQAVQPRVIILENVEEFQTWGPLTAEQKPDPLHRGATFREWVGTLNKLGYNVEWRELRACDYGVPTIRKRLFLVARCDDHPIVWPERTHGAGLTPYRSAAECIDWELPCPSIFDRAKPLSENTLRRIAAGIKRYVIDAQKPFVLNYYGPKSVTDYRLIDIHGPLATQTTENRFALVAPYVIPLTHHGKDRGQSVTSPLATVTGAHRGEQSLVAPVLASIGGPEYGGKPRPVDVPFGTQTAINHKCLVTAFMAKHYTDQGQSPGSDLNDPLSTVTPVDHNALVACHIQRDFGKSVGSGMDEPIGTITAGGSGKAALVASFLCAYYGNDKDGQPLDDPLRTLTAKERFALVTIHGVDYQIVDIGMRMLQPRELYRAQGFPDSYQIDCLYNGKPLTKTAQVRMVGNSVCPPLAAAIVRANYKPITHRRRVPRETTQERIRFVRGAA